MRIAAATGRDTARVYNIGDLTAGHMHASGPGVTDPVILPIPNLPLHVSGDFGMTWTWRSSDLSVRAAQGINTIDDVMEACSSGNCYINLHTTLNSGGEMRINMYPESRSASAFTGADVCHADR